MMSVTKSTGNKTIPGVVATGSQDSTQPLDRETRPGRYAPGADLRVYALGFERKRIYSCSRSK
jgi:hypothetical protein